MSRGLDAEHRERPDAATLEASGNRAKLARRVSSQKCWSVRHLGGGPCGLCQRRGRAAREGIAPSSSEREPLVGGSCATHARTHGDGTWRFDLGGHRFVSSDEGLSRWLESLLGDDLLTQERKSVVLHDGQKLATCSTRDP